MKLTTIIPAIATLTATVAADTYLAPFDSSDIQKGNFYNVSWVNDKPDLVDLRLVQKSEHGFKTIEYIFLRKHAKPPGGTWSWPVFQDIPAGDDYALLLSGEKDYDLSQWFSIAEGDD